MKSEPTNSPAIRQILAEAQALLVRGPHPGCARRDAETLLLHLLKHETPRANLAWLIAHQDDPLASANAHAFRNLLQRRLGGEPIQYITGQAEFYGLTFEVDPNVLNPRPETEHLVETALAYAAIFPRPRIVDVGTGSGAIAVALAHHLPNAEITAIDISVPALQVARVNAHRAAVDNRIRLLAGDLLAPVLHEQFELVLSNPPYVPEHDRDSLPVEVRDFEPAQALFAGPDGLAIYRRLIPAALTALVTGGFLLLEIGYGQQESVRTLLVDAGFHDADFTPDLQGIPRVASARRPSSPSTHPQ